MSVMPDKCPHCPSELNGGEHREYCPRYTGPIAELEAEIEGFRTFKDFSRFLCLQIAGLRQDLGADNPESFGARLRHLIEAADQFLLMYGTTGEPSKSEILGILTDRCQCPVPDIAAVDLDLQIYGRPAWIHRGCGKEIIGVDYDTAEPDLVRDAEPVVEIPGAIR